MKICSGTRFTGQRPILGLIWPIIVLSLLAISCAESTPERINQRGLPDEFVQGSFLISATAAMEEKDLQEMGKKIGDGLACDVKAPERIRWSETGVVSQELHNTYHLKFENCDLTKENTADILNELSGESQILSAEAEAVARATPIVENDPYKGSQGHLDFIKRDEACELAAKSDKPVVVAVIDTGVDRDHPDLMDSFYRDERGEVIGANFVDRGSSMPPDQDWDDGASHGTHVAGLIAAAANNSQGGVGVAACANVKIMPIRVLNDEGSGTSIEIERGVKWAADHGAQIINLSLGFTSRSYSSRPSFYRSVYADLARRNVLVLAASGNDGYRNGTAEDDSSAKRWHYPSSYDNVVSVAATNNFGSLASFSNFGERVDIAAPGYNVLSTVPGSYARMSGTSMATPVAAGVYALALASIADNIETDRIDVAVAEQLLDNATLDGESLPLGDVHAGGVISAQSMVSAFNDRFPAPTEEEPIDEEPVDEEPIDEEPIDEEPIDEEPIDEEPIDEEPIDEQPIDTPSDDPTDTPVDTTFSFVGLSNGDDAGWPQGISLQGTPKDTYAIYLYWGTSLWSFSKIYTNGSLEGTLEDSDSWYLYGDRTLRAIAVDKNYRVTGVATVELDGW